MTRADMMRSVSRRIVELEQEYLGLCGASLGAYKNERSRTSRRSAVRKDLDTCILIRELLDCPLSIADKDAIRAFDRLTEQQQ